MAVMINEAAEMQVSQALGELNRPPIEQTQTLQIRITITHQPKLISGFGDSMYSDIKVLVKTSI